MSRFVCMLAILALNAQVGPVVFAREKLVESRTVKRTVALERGETLVIDNLFGDVTVTGGSGSEVRVVAEETIRARNSDALERARRDVTLDVRETPDGVVICVDGPFRDADDCTEWAQNNNHHDRGYRVFYDMQIQIPRDVDLRVRTVEGELQVESIRGAFDVAGVNGGIEMRDIDGSGNVHTVNGPVRVEFTGNPEGDCDFKTINGEIEVTFRSGLAADLSFETMNGDVLSDFDYEPLPAGELQPERGRGRTLWRLDPSTSIRIASGGPQFSFENINGDILIRRGR